MLFSHLLLSAIAPAILLCLVILLLRRKLHRRFPFFFAYTCYAIAAGLLRETVVNQPPIYFKVYWITDIIYGILALLVIREVFLPTFTGLPQQYRWIRWIMPTAVAGIVVLAVWSYFYRAYGRGPLSGLAAGAYSFEVSMRWLELTIFLIAAILDRTRWRSLRMKEFGILMGFGVAAFITLLADLAGLRFGSSFEEVFRYLPTSAYIGAAGIWLVAFLYKEPKPRHRLTDEELTFMENVLDRQQEAFDKLRGKDKSPRLKLC